MGYRLWVIGMCVCALSACGVQIPIDDAYHWEDRTSKASTTTSTTSQSSQTSQTSTSSTTSQTSEPKPAQPTLEFTNVQDTTITVKIHR